MVSRLSFDELSPDANPWRIDWFGEVAYPGAIKRYQQPCIRVAISRLRSQEMPFIPDQTDIRSQQQVWMQLGSLPMLRVGDIWQNGHRVQEPDYDLAAFPDLSINQLTSKFVKAGVELDGAFLLPFALHPWHQGHTNAYCQLIKVNQTQQLLIPCAEIIRFYFGSSTNLLHALVTKPFEEASVYESKHFEPKTRHLHIKLAPRISGRSATDIGRIALDPHAQQSAVRIYASCLKATSLGQPAYPCTGLPFQGKTALIASGMWLPAGDNPQATFVVFNIRSCSHPFPFRSLTYEAKYRPNPDALNARRASGKSGGEVSGKPREKSSVTNEDAGSAKSAQKFSFDADVRFPDLTHKRIWPETVTKEASKQIFLKRRGGGFELVSLEPGAGSSPVRSIDAVLGAPTAKLHEISPEALPTFARAGISVLQKQIAPAKSFSLKLAQPQGNDALVFALPMTVDDDGVIDQGTQFASPDGSHRQRHACFVALLRRGRAHHYLAIIEGRHVREFPTILNLDETDIVSLLELLATPPEGA